MICDLCQGRTRSRRVTKYHQYKRRLFVIENVPAEVCRECGERYYHATTLDAIDRMLEGKHKVNKTLKVDVVSLVVRNSVLATSKIRAA